MTVEVVDWGDRRETLVDVRRDVFVEGQGVPVERELDGKDATATHFLATDGGTAVGTARLRILGDDDRDVFESPAAVLDGVDRVGKVGRVAVREAYRGAGWGRALMGAVERAAADRGLDRLVLHGQTRVEEFYEGLGYRIVSDAFSEADMPHVEMVADL
jgi:predicted GNAT family N-acyltransferase